MHVVAGNAEERLEVAQLARERDLLLVRDVLRAEHENAELIDRLLDARAIRRKQPLAQIDPGHDAREVGTRRIGRRNVHPHALLLQVTQAQARNDLHELGEPRLLVRDLDGHGSLAVAFLDCLQHAGVRDGRPQRRLA